MNVKKNIVYTWYTVPELKFTYLDFVIGFAGREDFEGTGETSLYQPRVGPGREEQGQRCLPERFVIVAVLSARLPFLLFSSNLHKDELVFSFSQETTP